MIQGSADKDEITEYIRLNCDKDLSLNRLSEVFFLGPSYIGRLLKKKHGKTFNELLNECRIEKAKQLLKQTNLSIHTISEMVGYKYKDHFYRNFKKITSHNPGEYREMV